MTTTVSNSTLSVTITEALNINGADVGSKKKIRISGINEVSKRIMTVATGGTQIYAGSSSASHGTFVTSDVKYVRITNLDDTNYIVLHLEGNSHYAQIKIPAGHVFLLTEVAASLDSADAVASYSANDITRIDAMANTAAVDVEIMVASA